MMQPKRTLYTEETVRLTLTLTMDHLCSDCNFFRILLKICNLKLITNNLIKDKCSVPWKPLCSAKFKESFPGWPFYNDKVSVQFSAKLSPLRNSAIFDNKKIICTTRPSHSSVCWMAILCLGGRAMIYKLIWPSNNRVHARGSTFFLTSCRMNFQGSVYVFGFKKREQKIKFLSIMKRNLFSQSKDWSEIHLIPNEFYGHNAF